MTHRQEVKQVIICALVVLGIYVGGLILLPKALAAESVRPSNWTQPYGGCKEAINYPRSDGAQECRDHGWVIRRYIAVNPRGVVKAHRLHSCANDEAAGGPCIWNAARHGNRRGVDFWLDRHDFIHPVWIGSPVNERWHWITRVQAAVYTHTMRCIVDTRYLPDIFRTVCRGGVVR